MKKIDSLAALRVLRQKELDTIKKLENKIQINVSLATCSIAAGGKEALAALHEALKTAEIENVEIRQSGCMTYCYAEPTVEVTLPGREAVIFGFVTRAKAKEIVENYIQKGERVEGVIETNFDRVIL